LSEVIRRGRRVGSSTLVTYVHHSESALDVKIGLVVGRAVGNAVTRNRVKRRLRHLLLPRIAAFPPGLRLVIRALAPAAAASAASLARDLDSCVRRAGLAAA
jgi:ribonuclease P protein component